MMSRTVFLACLVSCLAATPAPAQLQSSWRHVTPSSAARGVAVDMTGIVWTIELDYIGVNGPAPTVRRYSPSGALLTSYTGSVLMTYSGQAYAFCVDPNGQHATLAFRDMFGDRLMRVDATGALSWSNTVWHVQTIGARGLVPHLLVDAGGNVFVVGTTTLAGTGLDIFVTSFDANGAWRWTRTIDGGSSASDTPTDCALDGAGGLVIVGSTNSSTPITPELGLFTTIRMDNTGNVLWTRTFAGIGGGGLATCVATDATGISVVGGTSSSRTEALLRSYDALGNLRWSQSYSTGIGALYDGVALDAEGSAFATGMQFVTGGVYLVGDILTSKHDSNGALVWQTLTDSGPTGGDRGRRIFVDAAGRATVVGVRYEDSLKVVTQRFERDGSLRWRTVDTLLSNNILQDAAADSGGVLCTASTASQGPQWIENAVFVRSVDQSTLVCVGDGSGAACPCGNSSDLGSAQGCRNSAGTGARLVDTGVASVTSDTLRLSATGTTPAGTCVFVQGDTTLSSVPFGDGLRCLGGTQLRLAVLMAVGGNASIPGVGELSVSQRATAQGDVFQAGVSRTYQVFYRDSDPTFCAAPHGGAFNMSSGVRITWAP